jgi:hypothetical protein
MPMQTLIDNQRIVIVGMGSRGLSVLEQLIGAARRDPQKVLMMIELYDPQSPGSGLHLPEQPDYLMLNTMAGQLSAFSAAHPAWFPGETPGLTFLQWCNAQDLRLNERGHVSHSCAGRPIEFGDFVPRQLLGRYLRDSYDYLLRLCPPHVQVRHYRNNVIGCSVKQFDQGFVLHTEGGRRVEADAVFLTVGHAPQPPTCCNGRRVGIEGLGLGAMDAVAALTEGRGGRYVQDHCLSGWRYVASGLEPQIYLYSRSGLPFHCRPQWRGSAVPNPRLFFTPRAVQGLRDHAVSGRLDFAGQVLPLIKDEMRGAFYLAQVRLCAPERTEQIRHWLQEARTADMRRGIFTALAAEFGPFEPQDYLNVNGWQGDPASYAQWFRDWIAEDLTRSRQGVEGSPLTLALEVWRNCRDVLRLAADHDGLNDRSTLEFYGTWAALSNRLVGGPQKERYEDLLALIDGGVVTLLPPMRISQQGAVTRLKAIDPVYDAVIEVDDLISARNAHSGLSLNRSGLIDDLLRQGLIKAAHPYPADGIAVDASNRALHRDGSVQPRLWVLGPMAEGSTFYNHYVPTPDPACKAPLDARDAVLACLEALQACTPELAVH